MKIHKKIIIISLSVLIITSGFIGCISLLFSGENIPKLKKNLEEIPNVKVLDIWGRGDWNNYVSAIILINDEKLLILDYFTKDSFKDNKGQVRVKRMGDWKFKTSYYGYIGVYEIGGGPVKSDGFVFALDLSKAKIFLKNNNLPDIKKIQDVIDNYDLLYEVIKNMQEDTEYEYDDLENDMV